MTGRCNLHFDSLFSLQAVPRCLGIEVGGIGVADGRLVNEKHLLIYGFEIGINN